METIKRKPVNEYSIKDLREICQHSIAKQKVFDNPVGTFSRNFSIYFTYLFIRTRITPDQITVLSVLVFFGGLYLFAFDDHLLNILGALTVYFSIILDGCDGEVARFKETKSRIGAVYTEPVSHDIQYGLGPLFISWLLVSNGAAPYYYILGALAGIGKLLFRLLQSRQITLYGNNEAAGQSLAESNTTLKGSAQVRLAYKVNKYLFNNTGVFIVLFLAALADRMDLSLWFFGLGYPLLWLGLFGKQIRQISRHKKAGMIN